MFLQQFTWQQFLIASAVLSTMWYVGVIFLYYRQELKSFLQQKPVKSGSGASIPAAESDTDDLMGNTRLPEGVIESVTGEVTFVKETDRYQQLGATPDLLEDLKEAFYVAERKEATWDEFFELMEPFRERLRAIVTESNRNALLSFFDQYSPYELSDEDLEKILN